MVHCTIVPSQVVARVEVTIGPCLTFEACAISYSMYWEEVDIELFAMSPRALATCEKARFPTMHDIQARYTSREVRLGAQQYRYSTCMLHTRVYMYKITLPSSVPYETIPVPTSYLVLCIKASFTRIYDTLACQPL